MCATRPLFLACEYSGVIIEVLSYRRHWGRSVTNHSPSDNQNYQCGLKRLHRLHVVGRGCIAAGRVEVI